ncbi:MAG: tyrosine-type recombinase/integrase [Geminicoccaceae bacterium]
MPHNQYIHQRRQGWYVRVTVPPTLRPVLGKAHVIRSLKTRDVETARMRRWGVLAQVNEWFSEVRSGGYKPLRSDLPRHASCTEGPSAPVRREQGRSQATTRPVAQTSNPADTSSAHPPAAVEPVSAPKAQPPTITNLMELWLKEAGENFTKQTAFQHKTAIDLFVASRKGSILVDTVSRRVAGDFISTVLLASERKPKTINRIISSLSSMWRWAVRRGLAADNPWTSQSVAPTRQSRLEKKRPYQPAELRKLLLSDPAMNVGCRYGGALRDLIRLGLLTGARINELCELRKADVDLANMTISIREGKTHNAVRTIPLHSSLSGFLKRRLESGDDEFVFAELTPGGPDGKRSWYASKRYTALRRAILGEDRAVDFHSFRRTFATYLEHASTMDSSINASVIAELMGHSKQTLALNLYSGGLKVEHLRGAIVMLDKVIEPEILKLLP